MRTVFVAVICVVALSAQTPTTLTPAQALQIRTPSGLAFSPDGQRLAFVLREPVKGVTASSHIWVLNIATGALRQWTSSSKTERHPQWSPDGQILAFISDRDERGQIYLMPADGGEAQKLTEGKNAVTDFRWAPDSKRIAFLASEPKTEDEEKKERDKQDARLVDRDEKHARLWTIDIDSRKIQQITKGSWRVQEFPWLPSGDSLIVKATDHPESDQWRDGIYRLILATGSLAPLAVPKGPFGQMKVSPDGRQIAYVGSAGDGPAEHDLFAMPVDGGQARDFSIRLDRMVHEFEWRADGSVAVLLGNGFRQELHSLRESGAERIFAEMAMQPFEFAESREHAVALIAGNFTTLPEVWLSNGGGSPKQVSHFNDSWRNIALRPAEFVKYKSFDGLLIEAALIKPANYRHGAPLPTVVLVHGGPTGAFSDRFHAWGQLLASRGYLVACPNIRGSTGYGQKFIETNRADWGGADFKDVMAGVDWLVKNGDADPERLGIGGWSYGGYMTMWAVTQTNRFRAAVAGAGMSDLASEYGTEQGAAYDEWFYGLPYEHLDAFQKSSPITFVKNARTPTLILQGEADRIDPIGQSQMFYRALKHYGVKTDFVVYPREGHGITEEKHAVDVLERMVKWFDENLKGGTGT